MILIDELVDIAKENDVRLYETNFCFDEDVDISLKEQNISALIQIAKDNNIKTLFYAYELLKKEYFEVCYDALIDKFGEVTAELERAKEEYNEKLCAFDFSRPTALVVYLVLDGVQVGVLFRDSWVEEVPSYETYFSYFELEMERAYEKEKEDRKKKEERVKEEIIEFLRSTDEWHICTNQRLRTDYCRKLVKKYNEKYGVELYCSSIDIELEILWAEYKNNK